jgi:hypothetical protein
MRRGGTMPNTIVQAEEHGPSMMTRSPPSRAAMQRDQYAPILPPRSSVCAVLRVRLADRQG